MEPRHDTVFLNEAPQSLAIEPSDTVVDATIGGAGHFARLLGSLSSAGTLVGIDADRDALHRARGAVRDAAPCVHLVEDNFRNLAKILDHLRITQIDKSLFDLGWSGFQLTAGRGFSFQADEPLLMTYGSDSAETAASLVNSAPEEAIADILYTLGEERFARSIARAIVQQRHQARVLTTGDLVRAVCAGTPLWYQRRRIHPATKTFQALRIAVNDELGALREGLAAALTRTRPGGRIAVITFHSIEDRIVKTMFRDAAYAGQGMVLTRKPVTPSQREIVVNHRARSAKLRVFACGATTVSSSLTHSHANTYA
ncbi:MAG: 16S rRNA (cytosine(1402)-N(4))-methyltransferase [Parcubacteria group bacterium 21-54-25]|nr:MAG: 16S rRNA (cytosine(1402)-N(4))-methyltransferase [Parcubacteria group bacterium 21-54-25]